MIYITMAKDKKTKEKILIQSDYPTKKNFIEDLRKNGYMINPKRVATKKGYIYIMEHTNATNEDFKKYGNLK